MWRIIICSKTLEEVPEFEVHRCDLKVANLWRPLVRCTLSWSAGSLLCKSAAASSTPPRWRCSPEGHWSGARCCSLGSSTRPPTSLRWQSWKIGAVAFTNRNLIYFKFLVYRPHLWARASFSLSFSYLSCASAEPGVRLATAVLAADAGAGLLSPDLVWCFGLSPGCYRFKRK